MTTAQPAITREDVREIDRRAVREYGMTSLVLMENAGRGAAELLLRLRGSGEVCLCCGKGNNGGDGLVIARHLDAAGVDVRVILIADPDTLSGDAAANLGILQAAATPVIVITGVGVTGNEKRIIRRAIDGAEWIVDALLGTGIQGPVREPYSTVIGLIKDAGRSVLAVDLPSGLDCDTGLPLGTCVRAEHTATFVARKQGFDNREASHWTGLVTVLPIGVPGQLLAAYNL